MDNPETWEGPRLVDAFRHSEQLYHSTFGQTVIGLALVSLQGRLLEVNPAFCSSHGYSRSELLKMSVAELTWPEDLGIVMPKFAELASNKISEFTLLKRNRHKLGHPIWVEVNVRLVRLEKDEPRLIAALRIVEPAIEARNQLEDLVRSRTSELREIRRERDAFFELSPDVFGILDRRDGQAHFRRVNPAMCRLLEYTAQELCTRPTIELVHPDDRTRTLEYGCMSGNAKPGSFFDNRYVTKSGKVRWLSWTSCPSPDGDIFCIGRDITMLKARAANDTLKQTRLASACKLSALGRMAANISHEIKNPLTVVYGNACRLQLLLSDSIDPKVKRMVDEMESMSQKIVKIIDGLRGFMREASGDPFETVELHKLIEDTLSFSRSRFTTDKVHFEVEAPPEAVSLTCQPVQIQQVLVNLLNNAFEAALATHEDQPRMGVRYGRTDGHVSISVYDNGPGIDPSIRGYLFEAFFTTKKAGVGTGLGLNIAKTIVEAHQGHLYLDESRPETTFTIVLPVHDAR